MNSLKFVPYNINNKNSYGCVFHSRFRGVMETGLFSKEKKPLWRVLWKSSINPISIHTLTIVFGGELWKKAYGGSITDFHKTTSMENNKRPYA